MSAEPAFRKISPTRRLAELAARFGGELIGDPQTIVRRVASLGSAAPGDISFLSHPRFRAQLDATRASAVIVGPAARDSTALPRIVCDEPVRYFASVSRLLNPEPSALPDAALLELGIEGDQDRETAVVEVAAAGGLPVAAGRVEVVLDGRSIGRRELPALEAGERRVIRLPLPPSGSEPSVLSARIQVEGDPVPANDARHRMREPAGPRRALAVALGPTWDFAAWVRALESSHPGPVDAFWSFPGGGLRPADGEGTLGWGALRVDRYAAAYLFGDPAALGASGRAWVDRFTTVGGRGLFWAPAGWRGALAGTELAIAGGRAPAAPRLTPAGRAWLAGLGTDPGDGPDGGPLWPALEDLPDTAVPSAGATILLEAGGHPVAWVADRGGGRVAIVLGSGAYRWALASGTDPGAGAAFWTAWSDALVRWLAAASPAIRPLVRLPPGRVVGAAEPLRATVIDDVRDVRWRIEADDRVVARGALAGNADSRAIAAGPLPPGSYRLVAETPAGRGASEPFVVEAWNPELAWTAADRASGINRNTTVRNIYITDAAGSPPVFLTTSNAANFRLLESSGKGHFTTSVFSKPSTPKLLALYASAMLPRPIGSSSR